MTTGSPRTAEIAGEYEALRSASGVHLLPRDVLRIAGSDATSYLQGQCSQDLSGLDTGGSADALLLDPRGKIDALVRVTNLAADEFVLDTDAGFGPVVTARLERFRLRSDVAIEALPWVCLAVRGPDAGSTITGGPELVVPVDWPGLAGFDLLGPAPPDGPNGWAGDGAMACGDEAWEAMRIEAGMPVNGRELVEGTIAAEVGLVDRAVSFTKGCFTGQELVARLDARGSKVARRLCAVVIEGAGGDQEPASLVGASVLGADGGGEVEVGHLSSVAWSPRLGATVALATLHRRVTPPEWVSLIWETGADGRHRARAEARPLPLSA